MKIFEIKPAYVKERNLQFKRIELSQPFLNSLSFSYNYNFDIFKFEATCRASAAMRNVHIHFSMSSGGRGVLNEYTLISDILKQANWEEGKLYIVNYGIFM